MDITRRRLFGSRAVRPVAFRPPWSVGDDAFLDRCTRCDDCIRACPTGLLKRGDGGFPIADFSVAGCTFCGECATLCVTGAIARDTERPAWSFVARIEDACLARQRVECRVCGENCEIGAIRFRPLIGGVPQPEIDSSQCTGCGACIAPCPVGAVTRVPYDGGPHLIAAELA